MLFLWPLTLHPNFVPFHPGSQFSDLLITHLPNAEYIRDSLARYGEWPLVRKPVSIHLLDRELRQLGAAA